MSLGAEIAMQRLAAHLAGVSEDGAVVVASTHGLGSAGVDVVAATVRIAETPLCGLRTGPASVFAPPIAVADRAVLQTLHDVPLMIDVAASEEAAFAGTLLAMNPDSPAVVRVRGDGASSAPAMIAPPGMEVAFVDEAAREAIYVRALEGYGGLMETLSPASPDFIDEFATLQTDEQNGALRRLRFTSAGAEIAVDPVTVLSAPTDEQIDIAITERRAIADEAGRLLLALPRLSTERAPWSMDLRSDILPVALNEYGAGRPSVRRIGDDLWRIECHSGGVGADCVRIDLIAAVDAELLSIWLHATRRKASWEEWDEADAQLSLEESW